MALSSYFEVSSVVSWVSSKDRAFGTHLTSISASGREAHVRQAEDVSLVSALLQIISSSLETQAVGLPPPKCLINVP